MYINEHLKVIRMQSINKSHIISIFVVVPVGLIDTFTNVQLAGKAQMARDGLGYVEQGWRRKGLGGGGVSPLAFGRYG